MAILLAFCVRDERVGSFNQPFYAPTFGFAERIFSDTVNRPADDNLLFHHPQDFGLYHLGSFDDSTGLLQSRLEDGIVLPPLLIFSGLDVKKES